MTETRRCIDFKFAGWNSTVKHPLISKCVCILLKKVLQEHVWTSKSIMANSTSAIVAGLAYYRICAQLAAVTLDAEWSGLQAKTCRNTYIWVWQGPQTFIILLPCRIPQRHVEVLTIYCNVVSVIVEPVTIRTHKSISNKGMWLKNAV